MVRLTFCGVGEAFDESQPNTSLLAEHAGRAVLLDCGFTAAHAALRVAPHLAEALDGVYVTHGHGDHLFGLPVLLARLMDAGRTVPLKLIAQPDVLQRTRACVDLAYGGLWSKLPFKVEPVAANPESAVLLGDFKLSFARSAHSDAAPNLAVRVDTPDCAGIFYSGDGRPTPETTHLARGVGLAVHESYTLNDEIPGHGSVAGSLDFARWAGARRLALVHLRRGVRNTAGLRDAVAAHPEAFVPESGDAVDVGG